MSALEAYRRKRDFERTPEPPGRAGSVATRRDAAPALSFVVQEHHARRLHYDFRLEVGGVLKSWAIPKGPSARPGEKRLAVETEDHPLAYGDFEGVIPKGEYGGGTVVVWDRGYWFPDGDPEEALRKGHLEFRLAGEKLRGGWRLVRLKGRPREKATSWLLMKRNDAEARESGEELVIARPLSVLTGRDAAEVAADKKRVWHSNRGPLASKGEQAAPPTALGAPDAIDGAKQARMPRELAPQLATLVEEPPDGRAWLHEMKLDGYRLICRLERGKARLVTRNGNDWTDVYPRVAEGIAGLAAKTAVLDGEVVVLDAQGRSSFQALQGGKHGGALHFYAFDLLYLDGYDLRGAALRARKEALRLLLATAPEAIRYSDHVVGQGAEVLEEACRLGLEGIVSKRADAAYRGGRTRSWLKIKCAQRQELVVVGFTEPSRSRVGLGALLVAAHGDDGKLRYAGKVGTGFSGAVLRDLRQRLEALAVDEPPVKTPLGPAERRRVHWAKPVLVAEVAFSEWTDDGRLRHPRFLGLREDKPAREVTVERAAKRNGPAEVAGVRLTHPDKVLFPEAGITKLALAEFYESIAAAILPEIERRPLTLLRCPEGRQGHCFFQKHANASMPESVPRVRVKDAEDYLMIDGLPALVTLVQLGALELHVWGSRGDRPERPDRLVLDLDPDPTVAWGAVVATAEALRERLERLGLAAFVKLTGGKGLHVVSPITRHTTWDEAKTFTHALAKELVRHAPKSFTASLSKRHRKGKIFVDYLRNASDATAIAAYSVRAREGAPVAVPVAWDELDASAEEAPRLGMAEVRERVARGVDPWAGIDAAAARLTRAMLEAVTTS
jgi:bifunctional non-homologous end joining protein LigD